MLDFIERVRRTMSLYPMLTSATTLYASAAALGPLTIGGGGAPAACHRRRQHGFLVGGGVERRQ